MILNHLIFWQSFGTWGSVLQNVHNMKLKLSILIAIVVLAAACTDKEKIAQMQGSIDSLKTELGSRDTELTEYFTLVSDIESNISEIKERENMISLEQESNPTDNLEAKKQMVEDLKAINSLMLENKTKLEELNKKLQSSYYQTGKFKKLVAQLEEKVNTQETDIQNLTVQVTELTAQNETLNVKVDSLSTENTTKEELIAEKDGMITEMDEELHAAYYTTGTSTELEEKAIITKEGGFIGIGKVEQLSPSFNKNDFTLVDIRKVNTIPLNSKKVELVTSHPQDSYEIVVNEEEKQVDKLVILDPDKFWASSKYLVIAKK